MRHSIHRQPSILRTLTLGTLEADGAYEYHGVLVCSHFAAPYLKKTKGTIVNVVMDWDPGGLGYALTKTAGTPLTRGLARELAPVRVNAVSPGAVDTWGMSEEEE